MTPVRVVLVDDHGIVRQGLRSVLDPDPRFEVVGEAANGAEALRVVAEQQPAAVLLDLKLPDMSGVEVCQRIVRANPRVAVLILSAFIDQRFVDTCLRAGARGYLLKDAENLHLTERLLAVVRGNTILDPRDTNMLAGCTGAHKWLTERLSQRELEILRLIAQGLTSKEIGNKLDLSEHTVKEYIKEIMSGMGVHHRIEAVLLAKERGLI
jgi:DNA-binding NarL/FixJ family response regulator